MRRIIVVVAAATLVACTHDFGAFEGKGAATGDGSTSDQGLVDDTSDAGVVLDSALDDTTSTTDTTTPTDTATPPDTAPPIDSAPPCTDPGGLTFGGHCYFLIAKAGAWSSAKAACESTSAHLVTLTSLAEQTFVQAMGAGQNRWIGLSRPTTASPTDPKSFAWVTGEAETYMNWAAGEPNGSGECARMRNTNDWTDNSCTTGYDAICERE